MTTRIGTGLTALVLLAGCYESHGAFVDAGPLADTSIPARDGGGPPPPPPPPTDRLDLLFMIDNSGSMAEEQASLAAELPRILTMLASGDLDGDGIADSVPFRSIHAGVITSDMGAGGFIVPSCARPDFGDDGVLRTAGRTDLTGCLATYPSFLAWDPSRGPVDVLARDLVCTTVLGTGGCGFEQPLEAVLKALTPNVAQSWTGVSFTPIGTAGAPAGLERPFFRMSSPHGDGVNAGFVRDDAMLAIVLLTDEEDCSAFDAELFNPSSSTYGATDLNLRCFVYSDQALHRVERYVNGLLQLRRSPSRLAFLTITGIPTDLQPLPGEPIAWDPLVSPDLALRDDRLEERVDPSMPNRLVPSCNVPGRGLAFPPNRILQTARRLEQQGARVGVASICQESYRGAFEMLLSNLAP